ncbi:peptide alpha-N-acetyltransferase complex A subunit [Martiniozyma asiatica (nom. inval.)]|nr:peptide alpha-N-acetyltransferase complex A subunit [Martiniozyma asiatica]
MPITIRRATVNDLQAMQNANLSNLPENYTMKYYLYHLLSWPEASFVAVTTDPFLEEAGEGEDKDEDEDEDEGNIKLDEQPATQRKADPQYTAAGEKVVGYVLGKMNDDDSDAKPEDKLIGHVTSLSVMRPYRRQGIAEKLMRQCLFSLCEVFGAREVSLHVRESNRAALHLYRDTLKFEVLSVEKSYYLDGEDAYYMKKILVWEELVPGNFFGNNEKSDNYQDSLL